MSIYHLIAERIGEHRLFEFAPSLGIPIRRILISSDVKDLLGGNWISDEWEERREGLRADLDHFSQGGMMNATLPNPLKPYERKDLARIRLLHRWAEEIWEVRSTHKNPDLSIRILGRFAATDVFVALNWWKRPYLAEPTSRQWRDAKVDCKTKWDHLFHPYQPKSGVNLHDYISSKAILI